MPRGGLLSATGAIRFILAGSDPQLTEPRPWGSVGLIGLRRFACRSVTVAVRNLKTRGASRQQISRLQLLPI